MSEVKMITENEVVEAVAKYLIFTGFKVKQKLLSSEKGDDIVAFCPKRKVYVHIEAKGETSAVKSSKRYGKPFNVSQVKDHVANAFYRAAKMLGNKTHMEILIGIALPDNTLHRETVNHIMPSLKILSIEVFWVNSDLSVTVNKNWVENSRSG